MKQLIGATVTCLLLLSPGLGSANDIPPLSKVKTKVSAKAVPIAPPLTGVDGSSSFFGLTLPRQVPVPCLGQAKASAKIIAAGGSLTATLKVGDKLPANASALVQQQVTIQGRIHEDGCNNEFSIPELTFAGPAQGLPDVPLVAGKAVFTVTSNQILASNPGIFPVPRPLCPSDIITIRHRLIINGCWYEALFTIHHAL